MEEQHSDSFDISVDIYGNGEKNTLRVIPSGENHEILLNRSPFATLRQEGDFWILLNGDLDADTVLDIGDAISQHERNNNHEE